MSSSDLPSSSASAPLPPAAGPQGRDDLGLLDVLKLLIETKKARTTADLLKYATQYGSAEAEERLRMLESEGVPMPLAFDFISAHLRILAHKRNSAVLAGCRGLAAGLILPLPPHVMDLFAPVAKVALLHPGTAPLHGAMHDREDEMVKGARACRAKLPELQVLVFEAFREGDRLFADVSICDLLDPRLLPSGMKLIAHLRPHRNPQDAPVPFHQDIGFI